MKKVWVTALEEKEENIQAVLGAIHQYGLEGNGHVWADELLKMAWLPTKDFLIDPETVLWIIVGSKKDIEKDSIRYGLSLLTLCIQAEKGLGFHILCVDPEGDLAENDLPTPLKGADIISISSPSLGAKMVAKVNTPFPAVESDYRINIQANPQFGVWFEIGPAGVPDWNGAIFGVAGGEIDFHGVGPSGMLPKNSTLEYPMKGLKLQLGETEYSAWALQNKIDSGTSYYVRIRDIPSSILFGPYEAEGDDAGVNIIYL